MTNDEKELSLLDDLLLLDGMDSIDLEDEIDAQPLQLSEEEAIRYGTIG